MGFKDILKVTITDSKKSVKNLTDKQLDSMISKLNRFLEIASDESNLRFAAKLEADELVDNEIEEEDEV